MGYFAAVSEYKSYSALPDGFIDEIETADAGWTLVQVNYWSAWIDSRLRKRYSAPFQAPYPIAVLGWLARILDVRCLLRRGVAPTDEQFQEFKADAERALAEIKEAADSQDGLFDLPLRADTTATGITQGAPLGYSEVSPYTWSQLQREAAADE